MTLSHLDEAGMASVRLKDTLSGLALLLEERSADQSAALVTSASASSAHLLELARDTGSQRAIEQVLGRSLSQQWHQGGIDYSILRQELLVVLSEESGEQLESGEGRVGGSEAVYMDTRSASGDCKFDSTLLKLESQSNFSSLRGTTCVFKGKWMYEATLATAGIQQIGWATLRCPFTNEEGVGDAPDSFAYDGKRVRKWSVNCQQYGQPWVSGDVIGCCIDLEKGEVSFLRNGVPLGTAYTGIKRREPGAAYFPAVSLSHGEGCEVNFGAKPLLYPVASFLPLQPPPRTQAKRTVLLPRIRKSLSSSPGSGSHSPPAVTPTAAAGKGASNPLAIPVTKQPLTASSPPPLELPISSVSERPSWQGPIEAETTGPEPLPNLTPVVSPSDGLDVNLPIQVTRKSRPMNLRELLASPRAKYLLKCLQRLLELGGSSRKPSSRGVPSLGPADSLLLASLLIEQLVPLLLATVPAAPPRVKPSRLKQPKQAASTLYYVIWDALLPWLQELATSKPQTLERALDTLFSCLEPHELEKVVPEIMEALSYSCRSAPFSSKSVQETGSYKYLKLACALARRKEVLEYWWHSWGFEDTLEGLLTKKAVNKVDLAELLPQVWWPSYRDLPSTEVAYKAAIKSLTAAVDEIEELQVQLCRSLLEFEPSSECLQDSAHDKNGERFSMSDKAEGLGSAANDDEHSNNEVGSSGMQIEVANALHQNAERRAGPEGGASTSMRALEAGSSLAKRADITENGQTSKPVRDAVLRGGAFKQFLLRLVKKNKGVNRNVPPPGLSDNSVLVSTYFALLRILQEGVASNGGLLSRRGVRRFPVDLFLQSEGHYADLSRLGGLYSHLMKELPWAEADRAEVLWVERNGEVLSPPSEPVGGRQLAEASDDVRMTSELAQSSNTASNDVSVTSEPAQRSVTVDDDVSMTSEPAESSDDVTLTSAVREEELLDVLVLLYNLGIASNFKQASHFLQNQMHNIAQLDETDRQLASARPDQQRTLREVRAVFADDVAENARWSAWSRITLSSAWKQEGMYAACAWIVQMLLAVSKRGTVFSYVPEVYVESLVDSFHAIRRSDPPFLPPQSLLQNGLPPLVTFLVTHFTDVRIANPDVRDVLLQSISVLLNYKEYVTAFERNPAARESLIPALLGSFDNRFWIPVSNILLRMCKGSGFGASRPSHHGLESPIFQGLIKDTFAAKEALASSFLNKLFNMLNWTVTEFSVAMKEMQDLLARRQVPELQQRKCAIMFELSCNLERILEFLAQELPQLFLAGPEMNLSRLCELITFVLNHTTAGPDAGLFDRTLRLQMQSLEKISRPMILAPLIGILIHLASANQRQPFLQHDIVHALASADASPGSSANLDYLLDFNWADSFKGDPSLHRLAELKSFVRRYKQELEDIRRRDAAEKDRRAAAKGKAVEDSNPGSEGDDPMDEDGELCPICYAYEVDTVFEPCMHESCKRCISRHLLNNNRCFFCNAEVSQLVNK